MARFVVIVPLIAALLPTLATPATSVAAQPNRPTSDASLDLAAMTLTPDDVEPGFKLESGRTIGPEIEAENAASYRGGDAATLLDELRDAGFQRRYISSLAQLTDDETAGATAIRISSYVAVFDDAAGAGDGFAVLEDESGVATAEDVAGTQDFGDESEITRDEIAATEAGGSDSIFLDLTFRLDNLVAGVAIEDFEGSEPEVAAVEALATTLVERIETALDEPPGIAIAALRVGGDEIEMPFNYEAYERRDGQSIPIVNETDEAFTERDGNYGEAIEAFSIQRELVIAGGTTDTNPFIWVEVLRFSDERSASALIATAAERATTGSYRDVSEVDAETLGDESAAFSYGFTLADNQVSRGHMIYLRVGSDIAHVQADAIPDVPLAAVERLAAAQAACLAAGQCPTELAPPAELASASALPPPADTPAADDTPESDETPTADDTPVADETPTPDETPEPDETPDGIDFPPFPGETPAADETPEPDAPLFPDETPDVVETAEPDEPGTTGVDGETFVGAATGVSISWDDNWVVGDDSSTDEFDALRLESESSRIFLEAYTGFGGDAADCLADAREEINQRDGVTNVARAIGVDPPVDPSEAEEAVLLRYEIELDDGSPLEIIEYVECRTLVPGESVVEITTQTAAPAYEDELPLLREVLASITLPEAGDTTGTTPVPGDSGVDGNRWVSQAFGIEASWDAETWTVTDEQQEAGYDGIRLDSPGSIVYLEAIEEFAGDAVDCLADARDEIEAREGVTNVVRARGLEPPVPATEAEESVLLRLEITLDDGSSLEIVEYTECRTLVPGESVLRITTQTAVELYEDELPLLQDLLASIVIGEIDATATDDETPAADETPVAEETPATDETPEVDETPDDGAEPGGDESGVSGNAYTGPTFGTELRWDPDIWTVEGEAVEDGYDGLRLDSDGSAVYIETYERPDGDPEACLTEAQDEIEAQEILSNVEIASGIDGPETNPTTEAASAVFSYTVELEDGTEFEALEFVECRVAGPNGLMLELTMRAPAINFSDEVALVEELVATLELPGVDALDGERTAEPEDEATPAASLDLPPGVAGYQSPSYGFVITWPVIENGWTIDDQSSLDDVDRVSITNQISLVELEARPDPDNRGSAVLCLFDMEESIGGTPLLDEDGREIIGNEGDGRAFAAFRFADEGVIRYLECRSLGSDDVVLQIVHTAPIEDYEAQAVEVEALLADLRLEGDAGA